MVVNEIFQILKENLRQNFGFTWDKSVLYSAGGSGARLRY